MLTRELEETLSLAVDEAVRHKHEFVTMEHLLFALLEDPAARVVLAACGAQIDEIAAQLGAALGWTPEQRDADAGQKESIQAALSANSPIKLFLTDELKDIHSSRLPVFIDCVKKAMERGEIELSLRQLTTIVARS